MIVVQHNADQGRYEAWSGDTLAGFATYALDGRRILFTHTEVDDAFEGQGVGSTIARLALDDVRSRGGLVVVPRCPFIRGWIDRHPEYADLTQGGAAPAGRE